MSMPTCPSCIYAQGICEKTGVKIRYSTGCTYHKPKPMTNYDLLISKTPEELAEWLVAIINHAESDNCGKSCPLYSYCIESNGGMLDWLKAPVEVDE